MLLKYLNSNMQIPKMNLEEVKATRMNCYFSEVSEVGGGGVQADGHEPLNCHVAYDAESLLIVTKGGNKFYLPLDQQISRVFPMLEGVLIEFFVKAESKLQEILYYQKNKGMMDIQEAESQGKYCYASINRHPLNPVKILGETDTSHDPVPWYKSKEKITYLSQIAPILLTYNEELRRNAIHLLTSNLQEVNKEYEQAYIPTHTYSLKAIVEFPHFETLTQSIYESNQIEAEFVDVRLIKSTIRNQLYVYALSSDSLLRIFEVDLYGRDHVREVATIPDTTCLDSFQFYNFGMLSPEPFSRGIQHIDCQITCKLLNRLDDCILSGHQKDGIKVYHRGAPIGRIAVNGRVVKISKGKAYDVAGNVIKLIPDFFQNCTDALIARTLELTLSESEHFAVFMEKYLGGQPILSILYEMEAARLNVLHSLHLLSEELRLFETSLAQRSAIIELLLQLSVKCKRLEYIEYYVRQGFRPKGEVPHVPTYIPSEEIFDIFRLLNRVILKAQVPKTIFCIFARTSFVLNFMGALINDQVPFQIEPFGQTGQTVQKDPFSRINHPLLSQKVFHIGYITAVREQEQLRHIRCENREQQAFLYLIKHKQDHSAILSYPVSLRVVFYWLLRQMRKKLHFSFYEDLPELGFSLIRREDLFKNITLYKKKDSLIPFYLKKPCFDEHIKTLVHTSNSQAYFLTSNASEMNKKNNDLVFEEVDRLLSSRSEIKVKARDIESIPEHKWEAESQNILLKFANRKVSVLVGQGAFSLGTSRSFITDIIKIPRINLTGMMPNDLKITLELKDDKEAIVFWPEFHSGMAAGLRLSRHVIPLSEDHLKTWIFYQKPDTPRRDHSGFLLSLGLLGYLKCFSPTDIYQYLKPNNEFTSVAILLGVSASNIGRSDESLSKTLVLHIPVLLPPSVDLEIPINVQTSALIGIGLLHKGTCNRTMTEMTLSQIGKKPCTDKCLDREGYSLAAGWALGMICLGMRGKKETFRDLQIEQRLIRFIEGGRVMQPPQSMMSTNFVNDNKCSSIKEGTNVNLHITAPSALLAISLMYLKSNNEELAAKISIPNSFSTIEDCNPNHILLKTAARNLIMWDRIGNSKEYMLGQIPELIRFIFERSLKQVHEQYYLIYNVSEIDYQTITSIYANVLTGCALSMGLKYAGTGDPDAVQAVKWHIEQLKNLRIIKCEFANDPLNKNCIDQYEVFSLLSTSVLALSLILAGTCDIQCLKLIRVIRKKFQDSKVYHYGFNMALNMALGFVFLGYGNYTFNREDMSVASLLICVFPQFPNSPTDNKWHLQALRHFYVLAMEEKIFHAVDVDTNKVITVSTEMEFQVNEDRRGSHNRSVQTVTQTQNTPVLLQESKKLLHVRIKDEDYYDVDFSFVNCTVVPKAIYIKRKHFKDITPSLLSPENVLSTEKIRTNILESLKDEPRYTALLQSQRQKDLQASIAYLIPGYKTPSKVDEQAREALQKLEEDEEEQEQKIYYSLLKEDKLQVFEIYLNLKRQLKKFAQKGTSRSNMAANTSLIINFEKWTGSLEFQQLASSTLQTISQNLYQRNEQLKSYFESPLAIRGKDNVHQQLLLKNMPSARSVIFIRQALSKLKGSRSKQELEFLLYTAYPQCEFRLLSKLAGFI